MEEFTIVFTEGFKPVIKIGENGHWFVDGTDTGVDAQGPTGKEPEITVDDKGYMFIDGKPTNIQAAADREAMRKEHDEKMSEADEAIDECRTAVSALQLTYADYDGGAPNTDLNTDAVYDDINGGYPSESGV